MHIGMLVHNMLNDTKRAYFHYHQVLSLSMSKDGIVGHADWPPPHFVTESHEGVQAVSNAKVWELREHQQNMSKSDGHLLYKSSQLIVTAPVGDEGKEEEKIDESSMNLPFPDSRSQLSATRSDEDRIARLMTDAHTKIGIIEYENGNGKYTYSVLCLHLP
jgi:hypothetical protein